MIKLNNFDMEDYNKLFQTAVEAFENANDLAKKAMISKLKTLGVTNFDDWSVIVDVEDKFLVFHEDSIFSSLDGLLEIETDEFYEIISNE